jgi:hypothetical protein
MSRRLLTLLFGLLFLAVPQASSASVPAKNKIVGSLTVNDSAVPLTYACVIDWDKAVTVFLTDQAVPLYENPYAFVEKNKIQGVSLMFSKETRQISLSAIYHQRVESGWLDTPATGYALEIKKLDKKKIEGQLRIKAHEFNGAGDARYVVTCEVMFYADIYSREPSGIRVFIPEPTEVVGLDAGTAPGRAYGAYHVALRKDRFEEAGVYVSRPYQSEFTNIVKLHVKLQPSILMRLMSPSRLMIIHSNVSPGVARFTVVGSALGMIDLGNIEMVLEDGKWKVAAEAWMISK